MAWEESNTQYTIILVITSQIQKFMLDHNEVKLFWQPMQTIPLHQSL